ncbi:MAG: PHP-associated domain-containing protein [Thermodesulfobacteriota bacterium]
MAQVTVGRRSGPDGRGGGRQLDWTELAALGLGLVDTHVHTVYSDGQSRVTDVENVCHERGVGCCITDHNEIRGSLALVERGRVPTAPSLEVGSREKIELLVIFRRAEECEEFFRTQVEPYRRKRWHAFLPRGLTFLIEAARDYEALVSVPHPYAPLWKNIAYGQTRRESVGRVLGEADCIEIMNGSLTWRANRRAEKLCRRLAKVPLGGSDSHRIGTIGSVLSVFDRKVTSENLFSLIRQDRVSGFLSLDGRPHYMSNTWQVLKRHTTKLVAP